MSFDFAAHRLCGQRWFDDFELGERFPLPSRTMTDALFAAFQLASGDNHPIHYDAAYCRRLGMPDMPGRTTGVLTMRTEVVNQEGVTVMDGMQKYLLRRRPA